MLTYLFLGVSLGFGAAVQPGPFVTYLVGQAVRLGPRRALPAIFAPLVSDGPIIAAVLLLLTRFPPGFLRVVQFAGGLYVLTLAWRAFRAWRQAEQAEPAGDPPVSERQSVLQAALTNLLSPGPYIFWSLTCGPLLARAWGEAPGYALGFLGGFYGAMLAALAGLVLLFGAAGRVNPRLNRAILAVSAVALLGFGLWNLGISLNLFP